jgi:hypothetical protein
VPGAPTVEGVLGSLAGHEGDTRGRIEMVSLGGGSGSLSPTRGWEGKARARVDGMRPSIEELSLPDDAGGQT